MLITHAKQFANELKAALRHVDGHTIKVIDTQSKNYPKTRGVVRLYHKLYMWGGYLEVLERLRAEYRVKKIYMSYNIKTDGDRLYIEIL